ncbi:MAG TPA: radical SAM protein [Chitinivibrionales bacterium]|nr:radical SAM protein [Chitinivibrionales bacterium]
MSDARLDSHNGLFFRLTSRKSVTDLLDVVRSPAMRRLYALVKKRAVEFRAFVRNESFYCGALCGESDYNISVNSDMTISCHCQGDNREGILGDLSKGDFKSVFFGPTAASFRRSLAKGVLPIATCSRCCELKTVAKSRAAEKADASTIPVGIMVENTVACNLACISCQQQMLEAPRAKRKMTLDDIGRVSSAVRDNNIQKVYFFKYGEPFLSPTVYEELEILRKRNPSLMIIISTNGNLIDTDGKREAALLADHIFFSIDGVTENMVSHYQRGSSFTKAYGNMRDLVHFRNERGLKKPVIDWKYVLFSWNDRPEAIDAAVAKAKECGVDIISFWQTNTPYYGKSFRHHYRTVAKPCWKGWEIRFSDAGDVR